MENRNNNNYNVLNANFHHHNQNHNQSSSDGISRFLRQILVHPTDSPSVMAQWDPHVRSPPFATSSAPEEEDSPGLLRPQTTAFCDGISSGGENNDTDEYDCESEEGLIDEPPPKPVLPRSSSKRTRAAEVHNLSEKRRRSRINEKMKALQNLIPNSNKSDKASVLDEAIEYLKQLQLQVQMLTMRNGLNMHPMSLPGVLQPIQLPLARMNFEEENTSPRINMTGTLPVNQEASTQGVYSLTNQRSALTDPSMAVMPNIINSGNSFGIESSIPARFGYQLHSSSEEICWEVDIPHQQLRTEVSQSAEVSLPFGAQASGTKDSCSVIGREQLTNRFCFTAQPNTSPHLTRIISGPSELNNDIKVEPPGI